MKKIISIIGLVLAIFLVSGCSKDSMDNITIYTTVYPVEYVTGELYGNHAKIFNMYPQGINPYKYSLTDKQIFDYSNSELIIYNGLSKEKDYMAKMIKNNRNLKIIDSTNSIEYTNGMDELWINPSNILMIAQNIKEGLKEYVESDYTKEEINKKYEKLKMNISSIDADLKEMVENADNNTLLVQDNELTVLNKYGLNIISLDKKTMTDLNYNEAIDAINNGTIQYIYIIKGNKKNDNTKKLLSEYPDLKVVEIDTINNISTSDKNDGINYITIMNENIDKLKQELY